MGDKEKKRAETPIINLAEDLTLLLAKVPFKVLRATKKALVEVFE